MNRLGSGSSWLTRCCCFEKSLVRCSAYQRGKKRLIWGSAWFKVRKFEFLAAMVQTWADTQLWIQLTGLVSMAVALHRAFPASSLTVYPWDGCLRGSPQHTWRLTIRQLPLGKGGRLCGLIWTKPTYFLETGASAPLAVLCSFHLASEASLNILKTAPHPSFHFPLKSLFPTSFFSIAPTSHWPSLYTTGLCSGSPLWGKDFCPSFSLLYQVLSGIVSGI